MPSTNCIFQKIMDVVGGEGMPPPHTDTPSFVRALKLWTRRRTNQLTCESGNSKFSLSPNRAIKKKKKVSVTALFAD